LGRTDDLGIFESDGEWLVEKKIEKVMKTATLPCRQDGWESKHA